MCCVVSNRHPPAVLKGEALASRFALENRSSPITIMVPHYQGIDEDHSNQDPRYTLILYVSLFFLAMFGLNYYVPP